MSVHVTVCQHVELVLHPWSEDDQAPVVVHFHTFMLLDRSCMHQDRVPSGGAIFEVVLWGKLRSTLTRLRRSDVESCKTPNDHIITDDVSNHTVHLQISAAFTEARLVTQLRSSFCFWTWDVFHNSSCVLKMIQHCTTLTHYISFLPVAAEGQFSCLWGSSSLVCAWFLF